MSVGSRSVPSGLLESADADSWARLLTAQAGVFHVRQLRPFGVGPATIVAMTNAVRWQRVVHGVYATFTGPLPRPSSIAAALLYGGAAAVLSHRTAAEEWSLLPPTDRPIHITVPYGTSAITQPGLVIVHRSRAYRHIVVDADPPRTSRADTAVDVAVEEPDARQARAMLTQLMVNGVRPIDVERRLLERPPRRYRTSLAAAVRLVREGALSPLEELYAIEVEEAHGLPAAKRQAPLQVDGVVLWEDAVYDHVGVPLTVRLDGRMHVLSRVAFRDRRRDNAAELAGRSRWREQRYPRTGGWAGDQERPAPPPPLIWIRITLSSLDTGLPPSLLTVPSHRKPSDPTVAGPSLP
jgi:hypothetical protein